jgi:TusA-related sulfurtransferase
LITRFRGVSYNEYLELVNDYKKYKNDVMRITKQQPIHKLINYEKRGNSGVEGAYHLDHKYSIIEGFKNNISPTIIGNMKNLEFITWEENIKKRTKCSITINELINN